MDTTELEYSIIGAICIDPRCVDPLASIISSDDFTISACALAFETATEISSRGKALDPVIIADVVSAKVTDSTAFIRECMDICPTAANALVHARLLHKRADDRRLHTAVSEALYAGGDDLAATIAGICQDHLRGQTSGRLHPLSDALRDVYAGLTDGKGLRLDTGFPKLDGILKGIWGGNLVLIGARPGVGKSAFALDIAETVARKGHRVLVYSLEMVAAELAERLIARRSNVPLDLLIDRAADSEQIRGVASTCASLSDLPISICDEPNITVSRIRAQARTLPDLKLIIVDFISLMRAGKNYDSRNLELGAISRDLKNLAAELQIPIIALSQLNRGVENTEEPTLRSLRDSGELEQNANKIMFLWNIDKVAGIVGLSVAKNRRGRTGAVQMMFDGTHMRFTELREDYTPPRKKRPLFADAEGGD